MLHVSLQWYANEAVYVMMLQATGKWPLTLCRQNKGQYDNRSQQGDAGLRRLQEKKRICHKCSLQYALVLTGETDELTLND